MSDAASSIATHPSPVPLPPPPTVTAPPAATPAPQEFVVLTQPVTIQIHYGSTTLPPSTRLPVVSRDSATVMVHYLDQVYPIPAASTDAP